MATSTLEKDKFRNTTGGYIGVNVIDGKGQETGIAVGPGEEVWLSEAEQMLTANAPRDPANNPLVNGSLELIGSGSIVNMRPLRPERPTVADAEETGAAPKPEGPPEEGSRPAGEEVGTPEAVAPRRRRASTK